ncbi:HK97-gp10 family putative phage morphogenesis protein [Thermoactinomyces sp. CICC 10521]|uniref:HK97-gp10 family putative phage morphogenesis protein n=1 Tax=Thermoactinomyces sp. CICC 10521 TaxID=2767426 RepID=UPI001E398F52|nr:HK97-gp10 family putative phage morphogenesis protein [Thermoactinomyces sp. CICC 10521]
MEFSGLDEMILKLQQLGTKAARVENSALRAGAEELQETMSRNAPGPSEKQRQVHLKDNIKMSRVKQKDYGKAIEVGPGKESFYAQFLEFGTSKMSPKSFIQPSVNEAAPRVTKAMAEKLREGIGL